MTTLERIYTAGVHLANRLSPLMGYGDGKLARGIRGRDGAVERIERWASSRRLRDRPLIWFHAPSVGEGLQARAVMEAVRERRPDVQLAYTFFSPSAESFAARLPADVADYLPLDLPADMDRMLDALAPDVIAFSKTEIWPNLCERASRRLIPIVLLSATLPEGSSRLRPIARKLLAPAHARLTRVAAISSADAARFAALGIDPEQSEVMGDARFDQVWRRTATAHRSSYVELLSGDERVTIVAGSTWPPDEERLVAAFAHLPRSMPGRRLIVAPHEPTARHLSALDSRLDALSLVHVRLSTAEKDDPAEVVVVDRTGVLGDLYALADIAYVGGGFGDDGLHSVLEPAAFGVPVLFGPLHANAREAAELVAAGGAQAAADAHELAEALSSWHRDEGLRTSAGFRARSYVEKGLGAASRGADLVLKLLRR